MPKQLRDENSNNDGPSDNGKPLKKARYLWEVKGKHHLKEAYKNSSVNNNIDPELTTEIVDDNNTVITNKLTNVENDRIDQNSSDTNTDADKVNLHGVSTHSTCCNNYCVQKLLESADDIMINDIDDTPLTLVTQIPKNQEYYLRKWQARQIARGFVDNTINSVLETWSNRPHDAADLVDNYENDGQVEDDAILMAIQSHGLQSNPCLNQPSSSKVNNGIGLENNTDIQEFTHDNFENCEYERKKEQKNKLEETNGSQEVLSMEDPLEFLSAAVSVAIQKKGLSYGY